MFYFLAKISAYNVPVRVRYSDRTALYRLPRELPYLARISQEEPSPENHCSVSGGSQSPEGTSARSEAVRPSFQTGPRTYREEIGSTALLLCKVNNLGMCNKVCINFKGTGARDFQLSFVITNTYLGSWFISKFFSQNFLSICGVIWIEVWLPAA